MANNRYNDIRDRIEKRAPIRRKKIEVVEKDDNTFMVEIFPLVTICFVLIAFGIFYLLFNTYKEVLKVDNDGYLLNSYTLVLGSKKTEADSNLIPIVGVGENDIIYKNALNHYVDTDKDESVNIEYPLFFNNGLSIKNYNNDTNLIDTDFERSVGYDGLILSYGRAYDGIGFTQIDQERYLLLSYNDNVMINLFDLKVVTSSYEYIIPVNSFVYFEEDIISYYERKDDGFVYNVIKDADFNSKINFYYEAAKESFEYTYEEFLRGIDTVYIKDFVVDEPIVPEDPKEEVVKPDKDKVNVESKPEEFVWEKPSVSISNVKANVYSMTADVTINDKAGVIVKEPTFTFYRNNRTYLRRTYYNSGKMDVSGLVPDTTFTMVGTYTYLASDMETRIIVTFYNNKVTTGSISSLEPISLSFKNGQIYPQKIEVNNLKVTSDLESEAIKGVNKVYLHIDDKDYYLSNTQVLSVINGNDTTVLSPETLNPSSQIDYEFKVIDRDGNEIKLLNASGRTRTSKRPPNVSLRVRNSEIDSVTLSINERNDDNILFANYIYVVKKSNGQIIKKENVSSDTIVLTNLDPDQVFNVSLYADIDIDDGNGVVKQYELASVEFTSKPITTLGFVNLPMEITEIDNDSFSLEYNINARKTNKILTRLLKKLKFDLYDEDGKEIIKSKTVEGEEITNLKDGNSNIITFDDLSSNKLYKLVVTTIIQQGSTVYELGTVQGIDEITTYKTPALVYFENEFTTETMIDFDISIEDVDGTIETEYVRLELRDKDNSIIDTRKISVNSDIERVTYNNLNTNEFYNIYVYADGYNETNITSNYKSKYLLKQRSIYTQSGISGNIELVSSLRVPYSQNIADVRSEVKWLQMYQYYNIPKTVDENGNMHIYSKTGASAYTYDLSDYHGQIVTVSFGIKEVVPVDEKFKVYFTQYVSGTTSSSYSKELTELNKDGFRYFTFTFRVGSYYGLTNNMTSAFNPVHSTTYGQNYTDAAGFYISGGTGVMSEYVIENFEIHVQYDMSEYVINDLQLEQGSWNTTVDVNKAKTDSDYRVRSSKPIMLEGGRRYSFNYDNNTDYDIYMYVFNQNGKYEKAYGWTDSEYSIYVADKKYVRFIFRYKDGNGTISPDDINNFRIYQYVDNQTTGYTDFEYDLVTKIKVNLSDSRDEITTNDYYVNIYEDNEIVKSYNYVELDVNSTIENAIKELDLDEKKDYRVELGIKIRDRYYALSEFELSTNDEVLGISSLNDWVSIQPYGHYILLNDLDFQNFTDQRIGVGYRYFHGVIDFQGYTMRQATAKTDGTSNTNYYRIYRIENDAVLKNLVLDVQLNNQNLNGSVYGFVQYNYGTIENVVINITDTKEVQMPQKLLGLLTYYNGLKGVVKNFVVNIKNDLHYYAESALLVRENYGKITNGYMYGSDVIVDFSLVSGTNRQLGLLTRYNGAKSSIDKVFSTVNIEFPNNASYDIGGIFAYQSYGTISNSYIYGDVNYNYPKYGPFIHSEGNTAKFNNVFYISKNIYTSAFQVKASASSLYDVNFQKNVLGNDFEIDEMISLGYYPQVKFSSNKMPVQDYIELPFVDVSDYADIIYMNVVESYNDRAVIDVTVNNPLGEAITDISISDLTTTIIDQTYEDGKSKVVIEVTDPSVYVSKYAVNSISSTSSNGYISTRKYQTGELYLLVDMYKEINSVTDFININKSLGQNYKLMTDLDLRGYNNYYINNFSGKFEGNNHVIKNINILQSGKSGLFNQMNGTMQNVTFENIIKSSKSTYHGVIGYSNRNGKFYNVHVKNMTINITEDMTTSNMYIGGLVGYAYSSNIGYSSVTDITVKSVTEASGVSIGGLVGRGYGMFLNNSFAQNVHITVENAISTNGVGGLVGYEDWSSIGSIDNCYSTGKIYTNSANAGGIAGKSLGYITNSYSTVDIVSDMSHLGGIAGDTRQAKDAISNSIYLGNLYSSSIDTYIHRMSGNYQSAETNYAMNSNLINGLTNAESYGETILTYNDYFSQETYESIFTTDAFDYSQVSLGILPKLYDKDGKNLLANQNDNYIYKNMFNLRELRMDKHAANAMVTMYLDNPDNYKITNLVVEDADIVINRNASSNGVTIFEFNMTPRKYYDSYRVSSLTYEDENGEEVTIERNIRIDAIFYRQLSSVDQWQSLSTTDPENYLLTNDIDFTEDMKDEDFVLNTNVVFNRLESSEKGKNYSIKGINLNYTTNGSYHVLIQKVVTSMTNITFDTINISDTSTSTNNYVGIMMYNYGSLNNLEFKNITINAPKEDYVAPIGRNYGYQISNINVDSVNVFGRTYVSSFVAYASNTLNDKYDNINANNVYVVGTNNSVGALFGMYASSISYADKPIYTNMKVTNSNIGGKVETVDDTTTITGGEAYYVGGAVGYGDCNYCTIENTNVVGKYYVGGAVGVQRSAYQYGNVVKDSNIYGTNYYVGGVYGSTTYAYNMYLIHSNVYGVYDNTYAVGGLTGYESGYGLLYRSGVVDSLISNLGERTGGLIGYTKNDMRLYHSYITDSTVTGYDKTGGIIGELYGNTYVYYVRVSNTDVIAQNNYAGGVTGYYFNDSAYGSYNEGFANEVSFENVNVQSNYYAGGIFGGVNSELYYASRVRKIYFSGTVKTNSNTLAGIGSGDKYNLEVLRQPKIYVYNKSLVNNKKVEEMAQASQVKDINLLDTVTFYPGYIKSGVPTYNENDVNASYSDFIKLEKGKTYEFSVDYINNPNTFVMYLYSIDEIYKGTIDSTAVESYISSLHGYSSYNYFTFTAHQDCYIRINIIYNDRVNKIYLKEIVLPNAIAKDNVLDYGQIRERITWVNTTSTTTNSSASKLLYNSSYWDVTPIIENYPNITVNDLSGNNHSATGTVSSISSEGVTFESTSTYPMSLKVNNFVLPTTNNAITLSSKINTYSSRAYAPVFTVMNGSKGFGLFVHSLQLYVLINSSYYATGYFIPYVNDVDITVVYDNSTITVYADGNNVFNRTTGKLSVDDTYDTYVGFSEYYNSKSSSYNFVGRVYDVKVFNRALDEDEINYNIYSADLYDKTGLVLQYDFTKTGIDYTSYYPLLKSNSSLYTIDNQRKVEMPRKDYQFTGIPLMATYSLFSSSLSNIYNIYPSGVNTINIEFNELSSDLSFKYKMGDKEYIQDVDKKIYTLYYDYISDIEFEIKTTFDTKVVKFTPDELSRKISYSNGNYYYIDSDGKLYKNDTYVINDVVHIYNGLALLNNGKVYNISTTDIQPSSSNYGILSKVNPISSGILNNKLINTYYNYSTIDNSSIDGQMFVKDNHVYLFNSSNTRNDNHVYNLYNTEEYQIVLNNDGTISSYKAAIKYPNSFVNDNIVEMTFDKDSNDTILMIRYDSSNILAFNYITGEEVFKNGKNMSATIFEYLTSSLSNQTYSLSNSSNLYKQSKDFIDSLDNADVNNVNDVLNQFVTSDNSTSNIVDSEYISVYNNSTNKFDIFNVNEIVTNKVIPNESSDSKDTLEGSEKRVILEEKTELQLNPVNDKIKSNLVLYNYFYHTNKNTNIENNKTIIYAVIMMLVIVNLFVLSYIYSKKENSHG